VFSLTGDEVRLGYSARLVAVGSAGAARMDTWRRADIPLALMKASRSICADARTLKIAVAAARPARFLINIGLTDLYVPPSTLCRRIRGSTSCPPRGRRRSENARRPRRLAAGDYAKLIGCGLP
jgi:hypothetical protein